MTTFFYIILFTSIWCWGVKILTHEGMLFGKFGAWADEEVENGNIFWKPVITCAWCLPSIHTVAGYSIAYLLGLTIPRELIFLYPVAAIGASILTGTTWLIYLLINESYEKLKVERTYLEHLEKMAHWDEEERRENFNKNKKKSDRRDG